jgi:amino acid adenylation domain-containing protein
MRNRILSKPKSENSICMGCYAHDSVDMNEMLEYWRQALEKPLPILDLPTDRPRQQRPFVGNRLKFVLSPTVSDELTEIAISSGTTLFAVATAAWAAFLARVTGQQEIMIATPWADRARTIAEPTIDCFVSRLLLRIPVGEERSFRELSKQVHDITLGAIQHANIPFHEIVERLNLSAPADGLLVYQAMVALSGEHGWNRNFGDTTHAGRCQASSDIPEISEYELFLLIEEDKDANERRVLRGTVAYNADLFDVRTIERMRDCYVHFLTTLGCSPDALLDLVDVVSPNERNNLLAIGRGVIHPWPSNESLLDLIDLQTETQPHGIALAWEGVDLSYGELRQRRLAMAGNFVACGVTEGMRVAVMLDRSPELLIAILALMHLGATYVPIDLNMPAERRAYVIKDSGVRALVAAASDAVSIPDVACIAPRYGVSTDLRSVCPPDNDAYILYTSGTTGKPKGVRISHRSLLNDVRHIVERQIPRDALKRTLWSTSVAFDQSVEEMFPALCAGQTVVLVEHLLDPTWFERRVTFVVTTPSLFECLLSDGVPSSVRMLVLGGENVSPSLVDRVFSETNVETIYNSYGPTECTDQVATRVLTRDQRTVSIGKPITNVELYVLDSRSRLVPHGAYGELYIGGVCVSPGYLNREQFNRERFVENPFGKGKLYRTGDRVRWNATDNLEYAGRFDAQLKINGVRIEPAELELFLHGVAGVGAVHVTSAFNPNGENCLVAYVTGVMLDTAALQARCREALPSWLVPAAIVKLDVLPVNVGGKIDSESLPSPWIVVTPNGV